MRAGENPAQMLHAALRRVEAAIEQENAVLRENRATELADFNHRKHQGLLEINRVLRNLSGADLKRIERARVVELVAKLEDNRDLLGRHLKAVDEISCLLARAIQESESDGTYGIFGAPNR
jgi:hypothetical protein